MKHEWYRSDARASEVNRMLYAFTDRILWSLFLAWFVFACATSRTGPVIQFLSWEGFLPLSRLSFGVYLLHSPFFMLSHHIARERLFYSHYTLVSECFAVLIWCYVLAYVMLIACEGPTTNLAALLIAGRKRKQVEDKSAELATGQTKAQQALYKDAIFSPTRGASACL
ncbi:nose resistant to fluoxetine protein 6-like [Dermacentor silvarum]|uniref:nose resistant to fluoxetine protein 6-like n=1 Tax=Dermacentor silvarum TaxID=543639 RepID=UPI002100ADB4|nr:nose resistant to fluoxetine protein 6-like [Dermacentor silvarum]